MEGVIGAFTTFLLAAGPIAAAVTKIVDFLRNLFDASDKAPKWVWNVAAMVVALAYCLGWKFDVFAPLVASIPALESANLTGVAGQLATGVAIGGMAGFWHEKFAEWAANSHLTRVV